ncbi:hypothetical protein F4558_003664 [Micromonospora profundi]|nr:hypothetical protein [Micromonospora profundi]
MRLAWLWKITVHVNLMIDRGGRGREGYGVVRRMPRRWVARVSAT